MSRFYNFMFIALILFIAAPEFLTESSVLRKLCLPCPQFMMLSIQHGARELSAILLR
ncbi:MAG: hypothetical protein ACI93R_000807 [Flavobacteriales bacterium]|jgi:hypothetical protein